MARAQRLAAAGAVVAFVAGGVMTAAGIGTASAQSSQETPSVAATCLPPLAPCDEPGGVEPEVPGAGPVQKWSDDQVPNPTEKWPDNPVPNPMESWSGNPVPTDSWSDAPSDAPRETGAPWKPVDEDERRMPQGHPETGGGGLAPGDPVWPVVAGGAALLAGAGLAGFAVRRRKGDA
ncbi:hypothetical protein [Nonomuraea cavernae]|uniref:Gram-positive cocci surface proteins LPxTG domain-containing protein n=1 Tax=Nonomuraea cavernae TaxID=2045107 RepID=A0A917Z4S4_9ACTN|nr:hypothetical protein [Nonomuraea cavernae]MCA2186965.1 hypothetical protein [Nonomuraea cavernae]GGO75161.1 hypothetical protein GCM10012289_49550 [Nonomuraea cavernae]